MNIEYKDIDIIKEKFYDMKEQVKEKIVYVTGHYTTDVDSYVSTLLIAKLLSKNGINSKPILLMDYKE